MGMDIYGVIEARHDSDRDDWFPMMSLSWLSRWPEMQRELFYQDNFDWNHRGLPTHPLFGTSGTSTDSRYRYPITILPENLSHTTVCKWTEFNPAYSYHREGMEKHTSDHWDFFHSMFGSLANYFGYENVRLIIGFKH